MSLEKIFAEVFVIPVIAVVDALELKDIESWDSLTHMMLIIRLEEFFQIQFSGDEIADMQSVADARATVHAHGVVI
jgi:acyl carrier protein